MEKLAYIGDAEAAKNMGMSQAAYDKLFTSRASSKARVLHEENQTGRELKLQVEPGPGQRPKNPKTGKYFPKDDDKYNKRLFGQHKKLVMPGVHSTSNERNDAFGYGTMGLGPKGQ